MQYVLHAYDYTDKQALNRRMAVRGQHFDGARQLKVAGHFILGGALLDDAGKMIGSMMLLDFDSEEHLNNWLQAEVYITGKVWERIDIKPFRQAEI
ncbi:YciI family protein [Larkinella insperata]|uniref:YciI family protein n=1 Tax=Larkinella insperata TaxID=332158 RepID=A0ABW3Q4B1_9BACT|nr:YciI family protein [Larkinella insperata]